MTLWSLPTKTGQKAGILWRRQTPDKIPREFDDVESNDTYKIMDVAMDDSFVLLFYCRLIIVRKTNCYDEVVCSIPLYKDGTYICFHYRNGKIAAAHETGTIVR